MASLLLGLAVFGSAKNVFGDPGKPLPGLPGFILEFDEAGNGKIIFFTGEPDVADPGVPVLGGGIEYLLPVPVEPGDVLVLNPDDVSAANSTGFSDLLTYFNREGRGVLLYRSLLDESELNPDPADVLGLVAPDTPFSVEEFGPEGNNGFVWFGGTNSIDPDYTVYNGLSDVPEPSTLILGGLGLVGLLFVGARRRVAA